MRRGRVEGEKEEAHQQTRSRRKAGSEIIGKDGGGGDGGGSLGGP